MSQLGSSTVTLDIEYPENSSRGILLLKTFLGWLYVGVPHGIALSIFWLIQTLLTFVALFAILFTGKYPKGLFDVVVGYHRWNARVSAYLNFMVDDYPPFSIYPVLRLDNPHSVSLEVEYPETLSRGLAVLKFLFGWLYAGIPHTIALFIYGVLVSVAVFIGWWAILFTGKFPRGLFDFVVGYMRWNARLNIYLSLLRDEYPPFSGRP